MYGALGHTDTMFGFYIIRYLSDWLLQISVYIFSTFILDALIEFCWSSCSLSVFNRTSRIVSLKNPPNCCPVDTDNGRNFLDTVLLTFGKCKDLFTDILS